MPQTEPIKNTFEIAEDRSRRIIDDYLQLQIDFQEETIAECNQELAKDRENNAWYRAKEDAGFKVTFLRELQRRERNGL